jgi:hypothetical protein
MRHAGRVLGHAIIGSASSGAGYDIRSGREAVPETAPGIEDLEHALEAVGRTGSPRGSHLGDLQALHGRLDIGNATRPRCRLVGKPLQAR